MFSVRANPPYIVLLFLTPNCQEDKFRALQKRRMYSEISLDLLQEVLQENLRLKVKCESKKCDIIEELESKLQETIDSKEKISQESQSIIKDLRYEVKKLQNEVEKMEEEKQRYIKLFADIIAEKQSKETMMGALVLVVAELQKKLVEKGSKMKSIKGHINGNRYWSNKVKELTEEWESKKTLIAEGVEDFIIQYENLEKKSNSFEAVLTQMEKELIQKKEMIDAMKEQNIEMKKIAELKASELEALEKQWRKKLTESDVASKERLKELEEKHLNFQADVRNICSLSRVQESQLRGMLGNILDDATDEPPVKKMRKDI